MVYQTLLFWTIFCSDGIPWVCLTLILVAPYFDKRGDLWGFYIRVAVALAIGITFAECGKLFEIWRERPSFPSGHTTFTTVTMLSLAIRDRRWLLCGLPLVAILSFSLVHSEAHKPFDVAGGWFLSTAVVILVSYEAKAFAKARRAK